VVSFFSLAESSEKARLWRFYIFVSKSKNSHRLDQSRVAMAAMASVMVDPAQLMVVDPEFTLDASQSERQFVSDADFVVGCSLLRACSRGDTAEVGRLLEAQPLMVTFKDYDGRTALHVAASDGWLELAQMLIDKGAAINVSDRWGGSPLDDAFRHRHDAVADLLRGLGGRTGATDLNAALFLGASRGDLSDVQRLLASRADPNGAALRHCAASASLSPFAPRRRTSRHLTSAFRPRSARLRQAHALASRLLGGARSCRCGARRLWR
jgi:hypothetical protein